MKCLFEQDEMVLRALEGSDEELMMLGKWRSDERVSSFYGGKDKDNSLEGTKKRYLPRIEGKTQTVPCIIEVSKKPSVYIQYYSLTDKQYEVKADNRVKTDKKNPRHLGASLPGKICDIAIREGDRIEKGDTLMLIEAMKMETMVRSHISGYVDKIYVKNGDEVAQDELLLSFIPDVKEIESMAHPALPEMDLSLLDRNELIEVNINED